MILPSIKSRRKKHRTISSKTGNRTKNTEKYKSRQKFAVTITEVSACFLNGKIAFHVEKPYEYVIINTID